MEDNESKWTIASNSIAYVIRWPGEENAVLWFSGTGDTFEINVLGQEIFKQLSNRAFLTLSQLSEVLSQKFDDSSASDFKTILPRYLNQFKLLGMLEEISE